MTPEELNNILRLALTGELWAMKLCAEHGLLEQVSPSAVEALRYARNLGWAIIPQNPATKSPLVRWKHFKDRLRRPTEGELRTWYTKWPTAGVILLLGRVSGVLAIDVDGAEAERVLVDKLGRIPKAPQSWRAMPGRSHLLFQHPTDIETIARYTPWHKKLEFRGHGGYVVIPPSVHPSGSRYVWLPDRSPWELDLPELPEPIRESLLVRVAASQQRMTRASAVHQRSATLPRSVFVANGLSRRTQEFLSGQLGNSKGWNANLFAAACDLAGNGVPEARAVEWLLAGARPWDEQQANIALATIHSAYSQPRTPAIRFQRRRSSRKRRNRRIR